MPAGTREFTIGYLCRLPTSGNDTGVHQHAGLTDHTAGFVMHHDRFQGDVCGETLYIQTVGHPRAEYMLGLCVSVGRLMARTSTPSTMSAEALTQGDGLELWCWLTQCMLLSGVMGTDVLSGISPSFSRRTVIATRHGPQWRCLGVDRGSLEDQNSITVGHVESSLVEYLQGYPSRHGGAESGHMCTILVKSPSRTTDFSTTRRPR